MSYPDTTAATFSWVDQPADTYPKGSIADFTWVQGLRSPRIDAVSSASAVSLVTAVSVGNAAASSLADGQTSERTPSIEGTSFVIGTENAPGVTKGDANGSASAEAAGYSVFVVSGVADGTSQSIAYGLVSLTSTGQATGTSIADGRGIFNKDFAGVCGSASTALGRSAVHAVSTGTCNGVATVGTRRRANENRNQAVFFSTDGVATGRANGRSSVGKKPRWRLARVVIPMTGEPPAVGSATARSSARGVSAHG